MDEPLMHDTGQDKVYMYFEIPQGPLDLDSLTGRAHLALGLFDPATGLSHAGTEEMDATRCGLSLDEGDDEDGFMYGLTTYVTCPDCGNQLISANGAMLVDRDMAERIREAIMAQDSPLPEVRRAQRRLRKRKPRRNRRKR